MIKLGLVLTALVLAFGIVTHLKSTRNDRRAEADHPPLGRFLDVGGHRVHVHEMGTGAPLVLLHGAGGSLRDMTFGLAQEMAKTHRVILFDRPGHGFTDPLHDRGASPQEQAALFWSALDQMSVGNVRIAGYSYGGAVALAMGVSAPERVTGMVLIAAVTNRWTIPPSWTYDVMGQRALSFWTNPLVSAWIPEGYIRSSFAGVYAPEAVPEGLLDHFGPRLTTRKVTLRANARQVITMLGHVKALEAEYHHLSMPIEALHGDSDGSLSIDIHANVLASQVASVRLKELVGVGHGLHQTQQTEVLAALARLEARIAE